MVPRREKLVFNFGVPIQFQILSKSVKLKFSAVPARNASVSHLQNCLQNSTGQTRSFNYEAQDFLKLLVQSYYTHNFYVSRIITRYKFVPRASYNCIKRLFTAGQKTAQTKAKKLHRNQNQARLTGNNIQYAYLGK